MKLIQTFSTAWQRTIRYKGLWPFGLLFVMTSNFNLNFRTDTISTELNPNQLQSQLQELFSRFNENTLVMSVGLILLLTFLLVILSFFLPPLGMSALAKGALMAERNENEDKMTASNILRHAKRHYWAFFRLSILIFLVSAVAMFVLVMPFACLVSFVAIPALGIPIAILVFIVSQIVQIIYFNAQFSLVDKSSSARDSLKASWEKIKANFWPYFKLYIVTGLIVTVVKLLISLPMFFMLLPFLTTFDLASLNIPGFIAVAILTTLVNFSLSAILNPFVYHSYVQAYEAYREPVTAPPASNDEPRLIIP